MSKSEQSWKKNPILLLADKNRSTSYTYNTVDVKVSKETFIFLGQNMHELGTMYRATFINMLCFSYRLYISMFHILL